MTMIRNLLLTAIVILLAWIAGRDILMSPHGTPHVGHDHPSAGTDPTAKSESAHDHADEMQGPHGGRTHIAQAKADAAGVQTEVAGPQTITETRTVTGYLQVPPDRVAQVRARFPGVVETVHGGLGNRVRKGDVLVTVQSNESLGSYSITAPISGSIVAQDARPGETTDEMVLVVVADTSRLWAELDLFPQDLARMRVGQTAHIETLSGETSRAPINWISPLAAHPSQSVRARILLDNADGKLRPGQFISARVVVAENEVPLAVKHSALQRFRDADVVFARLGETYEVRMIEPGRADDMWLEVTGGLAAGTEYVVENSYLIKADLEKSGASHEH